MKRMFTSLILVLFTCSLVLAAVPAGYVMAKVMEIQSSDTSALDLRLTLIEPNGQMRERRIQTLSQTKEGLTSSLTVFLSLKMCETHGFSPSSSKGEDRTVDLSACLEAKPAHRLIRGGRLVHGQ